MPVRRRPTCSPVACFFAAVIGFDGFDRHLNRTALRMDDKCITDVNRAFINHADEDDAIYALNVEDVLNCELRQCTRRRRRIGCKCACRKNQAD